MSTLETLVEMGFPKEKAERALAATNNQGVEAAMEWLLAHNDDDEVEIVGESGENKNPQHPDEAASSENPAEVAKSLKCDECGKLFKSEIEVEYHAAKSGHQSFSESLQEIKPLTEEEKKEQLKKLEERMKQRRFEKDELAKKEQVEKEKMRRVTGQQIAEMKKKQEEEELKKIAEMKRREKIEEKLARQRVLDQIKADKEARKAKFENAVPAAAPVIAPTQEPATSTAPKEYSQTKIQVRLSNGATLSQSFGSKEELASVRLFVEMNRTDGVAPFNFMTNFPKKIFTEEDMEKPLDLLGLVPSAVLILSKK